jgi:hypothetical protein
VKADLTCKKCDMLTFKLQKIETELESSKTITKILHVELTKLCDIQRVNKSDERNISETSKNEWKVVKDKHLN